MLTKDQIIAAKDQSIEPADVPEWGGGIFLRVMSGTERDGFETTIIDDQSKVKSENVRSELLVRCICDDQGARLFADSDAASLGGKSSLVLDRLFTQAQKLNKIRKQDVDELTKN